MVVKRVSNKKVVLEFWTRMSRLCATRRARSVRRTVDYLTAISRKQQGPQHCSGNTTLVPSAILFGRMSGSASGYFDHLRVHNHSVEVNVEII